MSRKFYAFLTLPFFVLALAGCATTRARKAETPPDTGAQMTEMQTKLQSLEQENQELRSQLESQQQALSGGFSDAASDKSDILRVRDVSATQLQKALRRAGYDPGPIDGRLGKKTRSAVKAFQRRQNLGADGVVGDKTWAALQGA